MAKTTTKKEWFWTGKCEEIICISLLPAIHDQPHGSQTRHIRFLNFFIFCTLRCCSDTRLSWIVILFFFAEFFFAILRWRKTLKKIVERCGYLFSWSQQTQKFLSISTTATTMTTMTANICGWCYGTRAARALHLSPSTAISTRFVINLLV